MRSRLIYTHIAVVVLLALLGVSRQAYAELGIGANLSYIQTKTDVGGVTRETSDTKQSYHLNLGHDIPLTHTIHFSGDLVWSEIETSGGEKRRSIYPVFTLNFSPPKMYNIGFGYSRTDVNPSGGDQITSTNMNVSFLHPPSRRIPQFLISYNVSTTEDQDAPKSIDNVNRSLSGSTQYSTRIADTSLSGNYTASFSQSEDKLNDISGESISHRITLNAARRFMKNKISTSANFGYTLSDSTNESTGGKSRFERREVANMGLAINSAVPAAVTLGVEAELIDNGRATAVTPLIDINNADWNIGLGFVSPEQIHAIDIFVNTTLAEETNIKNGLYDFGWALYTSNDNITWSFAGAPVPTYNSFYNRFEFDFADISARYFKLVNTAGNGAEDINVTEIQAYGFFLSNPKKSFTSTLTRQFGWGNVSYSPTKRMNLGAVFGFDRSVRESVAASEAEDLYTMFSLSMSYTVIPKYLRMSSSYSANRWTSESDSETSSDVYSVSFASTPMNAINTSLSFSHGESGINGVTQTKSDGAALGAFLRVYPGVDFNFSSSMNQSENLVLDSESNSRSFAWNMKLVPWKKVTTVLNGGVTHTTTKAKGTTTSSSSQNFSVTASYAPSRFFFVSTSQNIDPTRTQSYGATWVPTSKIQFGVRMSKTETTNGYGGTISWQPFSRLNLHGGYNATLIDNATNDKNESVFARASISL